MNTINKFNRGNALVSALTTGALVIGMFQIPTITKVEFNQKAEAATVEIPIANTFFGDKAGTQETTDTIAKQVAFVSSRDAYQASLAVVERHAKAIKATADEKGVPQDVAIGVALLENGGSETAKSPAGALGIYQLMPHTAENLGLTVNKTVDDRKDPGKSIEAGVSYLKSNYDRFGDWGLATWAYHAGEGNVAKALKIYAKNNDNLDLAGISNFPELHDYVSGHQITISKLLSDPKVKEFTDTLHDDTAGYPFKVIATAKLFRDADSNVEAN
jgi:hypothetical protein